MHALYVVVVRPQDAGGRQNSLTAGLNCPGARETWVDRGAESRPLRRKTKKQGRQKERGTCPKGYSRHTAGIFDVRPLWVGWVCRSLLEDQIREITESIL